MRSGSLGCERGMVLPAPSTTAVRIAAVVVARVVPLRGGRVTVAHGGREVLIEDTCDPGTFNAAVGPGTCVGGDTVTFAAVLSQLNPADGGQHAWRFSRDALGIKAGAVVQLANTGGELHTVTAVVACGAGDFLGGNAARPPGTPHVAPVNPLEVFGPTSTVLPPSALFPGQTRQLAGLARGTHQYQCLIHPWMRTTVTVQRT